MRRLLFFSIASLYSLISFSQEAMILPRTETFSLGTESAYIIDINGLTFEEAAEAWVDYTKDKKAKAKKSKNGEYFSDDIEVAGISDNSIDLYAVFEKVESGSRAKFWFDMGGAYFTDDLFPDRVAAQRSFLAGYITRMESMKIDKEVTVLEDELKARAKENKSIRKEIAKLTKKNDKLKKEIEENNRDLDKLMKQNEVINSENKSKSDRISSLKDKSKSMRN